MSKRVAGSLRLQLFCAVLISLVVAVCMFGASFFLGDALLDRTVYGTAFSEWMADQQFSKLQDYVENEEISLDNLQRLNAWCSRGEKVYLTCYHEGVLVYESPFSGKMKVELDVHQYDPAEEDPDSKYMLTLEGGTGVRAFLYYYAGDAFYFGMTALSGLLAFVAFSLSFVALINRKVTYITQLQQELEILSSGQLEHPITVSGSDELGKLASGLDQMRKSVIRHQEMEAQMRSANSELITAMSHDLRTPLTSLLAYLEIIQRKKYADEEQMHSLIGKSVGQTMRIKTMADKLFTYFQAYTTDWEDAEMEEVDADQLFDQMLGDYIYALESKGLRVQMEFSRVFSKISVNGELMQRALDNLYSNLLKYADFEKPLRISYQRKGRRLLIAMVNSKREADEKSDSTGIGLITCRRMIEYHKGQFEAGEKDGEFEVTVSLPLKD